LIFDNRKGENNAINQGFLEQQDAKAWNYYFFSSQ